jgi:hypothetical protein
LVRFVLINCEIAVVLIFCPNMDGFVGYKHVKIWSVFSFLAWSVAIFGHAQTLTNCFYTTPQSTALSVSTPGVLGNLGGTSWNAALVGAPAQGTLALNPDGSFLYTPTNNFTGMDGFLAQAVSDSATSIVVSVDIMVLPPNELFYDNFARPANDGSDYPYLLTEDSASPTV